MNRPCKKQIIQSQMSVALEGYLIWMLLIRLHCEGCWVVNLGFGLGVAATSTLRV